MGAEELLGRVGDVIGVRRAFGDPVEHGDTLVVPVAVVIGGAGGGGDGAGPGGAGAGGGGLTWPLGVYVVRGGTARWVPALDATRVVLAALGIIRVVVATRGAARRRS